MACLRTGRHSLRHTVIIIILDVLSQITHRTWATLVRPLGPSGPSVCDDVGVLGAGAAFGSPGPEGHERQRKRLGGLKTQRDAKTTPDSTSESSA